MSNPSKANLKGRFWQKHLSQWRDTTLTQSEYCRQHELRPDNFSYHKCKSLKVAAPKKPKGFIQVQLPEKTVQEPLTLCFGNGSRLTGITETNLSLVKQLAEALACHK
jgi:hypothetical protein